MTRQEANLRILEELKAFVENNPDIRFGQALVNLKVNRDQHELFYVESTVMLAELWGVLDRLKEERELTEKRDKCRQNK